MSSNKVLLRSDRLLVNMVKNLNRNVRELKTPQHNGADVLPVSISGAGIIGPFSIPAGAVRNAIFTVIPSAALDTLWNFPFTAYVDSMDDAHKWPDGGSLSTAQQLIEVIGHQDYQDYNQATNVQTFKVRVINNDVSSHNIYVALISLTPFV